MFTTNYSNLRQHLFLEISLGRVREKVFGLGVGIKIQKAGNFCYQGMQVIHKNCLPPPNLCTSQTLCQQVAMKIKFPPTIHHYTFENKQSQTKIFVFRMLTVRDVQFYGTIAVELRLTNKSGNVSCVTFLVCLLCYCQRF